MSKLYSLIARFRKPEKRILVIKVDAIGDYILFRDYLKVLKESDKYKDYEIDLLGNIRWKDLALEYDSEFISKFIFADADNLYEDPQKVFQLGKELYERNYETVLQSTYSRSLIGNAFSKLAFGKQTIAYRSDHEHHPKYKKRTDKFYTRLIDLPPHLVHETEFNHYFFEQVLEQPLPFLAPSLPIQSNNRSGIMIFAGSSTPQKNWEKENFLAISKLIIAQTDEAVILGGGELEKPVAKYLLENLPSGRVIDKTGATSLPEFVKLIASSKLVISNDTNSVHVAAACNVPVVCILGGGHFERFLPYPDSFPSKPVSVYTKLPCYYCSWKCELQASSEDIYPCISKVSVEQVWTEVLAILTDLRTPV